MMPCRTYRSKTSAIARSASGSRRESRSNRNRTTPRSAGSTISGTMSRLTLAWIVSRIGVVRWDSLTSICADACALVASSEPISIGMTPKVRHTRRWTHSITGMKSTSFSDRLSCFHSTVSAPRSGDPRIRILLSRPFFCWKSALAASIASLPSPPSTSRPGGISSASSVSITFSDATSSVTTSFTSDSISGRPKGERVFGNRCSMTRSFASNVGPAVSDTQSTSCRHPDVDPYLSRIGVKSSPVRATSSTRSPPRLRTFSSTPNS